MNRFLGIFCGLLMAASASAHDIVLAWSPSPDVEVSGYKIYYAQVGQALTNVWRVGNTNITTITNLVSSPSITYRFTCVATNLAGIESEATMELLTVIPPHSVKNPRFVGRTDNGFALTWQPSDEVDVVTYRIAYGTVSPWTATNVVSVAAPTTYVVLTNFLPNAEYYFDFTVVNSAGVESWPRHQLRSSLLPSSGPPDLKAVITFK